MKKLKTHNLNVLLIIIVLTMSFFYHQNIVYVTS